MNRIVKAKVPGKRYGFYYLLECNYCHKDFPVNGSDFKNGVGKFCSYSCRTAHRNTTQKGEKSNNWKGGRINTSWGYILAYSPNHPNKNSQGGGYVPEHRLTMEKHLGRYLEKDEIVHHLNGVKNDNRIENLLLMKNTEHVSQHYSQIMTGVVRDSITGRFVHK